MWHSGGTIPLLAGLALLVITKTSAEAVWKLYNISTHKSQSCVVSICTIVLILQVTMAIVCVLHWNNGIKSTLFSSCAFLIFSRNAGCALCCCYSPRPIFRFLIFQDGQGDCAFVHYCAEFFFQLHSPSATKCAWWHYGKRIEWTASTGKKKTTKNVSFLYPIRYTGYIGSLAERSVMMALSRDSMYNINSDDDRSTI